MSKLITLDNLTTYDSQIKEYVNTSIAVGIEESTRLVREIVQELPSPSEAKENVIYMIVKTGGDENNTYDEYMFINGKVEKIGDTKVDLTGYATEDYVNNFFGNKEVLANISAEDVAYWDSSALILANTSLLPKKLLT